MSPNTDSDLATTGARASRGGSVDSHGAIGWIVAGIRAQRAWNVGGDTGWHYLIDSTSAT